MDFISLLLMIDLWLLKSLSVTRECSCMAPCPPSVMVIKEFTFHPQCFNVSISGPSYSRHIFYVRIQ